MKPTLCLLAAALAAFFSVHAGAASTSNKITIARTVQVQDLDLTSERDRAVLDRRIKTAARRVCYELFSNGRAMISKCVNEVSRKRSHSATPVSNEAATASNALLSCQSAPPWRPCGLPASRALRPTTNIPLNFQRTRVCRPEPFYPCLFVTGRGHPPANGGAIAAYAEKAASRQDIRIVHDA